MNSVKMPSEEIRVSLKNLDNWKLQKNQITKSFKFKDHYIAMAFINAIAWISHSQDHHPDMMIGYNQVSVSYCTHSASGITEKDFVCAKEVDKLIMEDS